MTSHKRQWIIFTWCFIVSSALVVRLQPAPNESFSKVVLLPVQIPRLLQDPQNIPHNYYRSFGFKKGGQLLIDFQISKSFFASILSEDNLLNISGINDESTFREFPLFFSLFDAHSIKSQQSVSLFSLVWMGVATGLEWVAVALEALGGGIARSVLEKRTNLISPNVEFFSKSPSTFSFISKIDKLLSLFATLPSNMREAISEPSSLGVDDDELSQRGFTPSTQKDSEESGLIRESNIHSTFRDWALMDDEAYLLLMTEGQWVRAA